MESGKGPRYNLLIYARTLEQGTNRAYWGIVAMAIATRNLMHDKLRLALSVAGVALAIMLILILTGFLAGVYKQASTYLDNTPGSVLVVQEGVSNFFGTSSVLPDGTEQRALRTDGVAGAIPVTSQVVIFELHGQKESGQRVGYDSRLGGGPWNYSEGRGVERDDEVVVDEALARTHNINGGDRITPLGREFSVVGQSDGTSMWAASLLFVRKSALEEMLSTPGVTSLLLVTPDRGTDPQALRERLEGLPDVAALLKSQVAANDQNLFARIYTAPLTLMVVIAFLVGALIVGLIIYTATVERQREYGVLKAIGSSNAVLYRVVTAQALIAALVGFVAGVGLAYVVSRLIMTARPQFLVEISPAAVAWALLAGLVMALLGAIFPARSVATLAPADVFRR
jgi:putative ABC transport system permease protein